MPKLDQKNIKNKVKNTQKYFPNPLKMGPKSLPGTLLGALLQKVPNFLPIFVPRVAKWEPRGSPRGPQNQGFRMPFGPRLPKTSPEGGKWTQSDQFYLKM